MTGDPGPQSTDRRGAVGMPELESVTGPDGRAEVIGADADDGPRAAERAAVWLRDRSRRHPWVMAGVIVLAVAAALVPVAMAARERLGGPQPPAGMMLSLAPATDDQLWPSGGDLRPSGPPVVGARVGVRLPAATELGLTVTGLTGPGVTQDRATAETLPPGATGMSVPVRPLLDCDRLPEPSNDPGYRVAVVLTSGGRQVTRSLPVDARSWAAAAQQACRTWRARRDLTVTALSARVDPVESRLTVTATVRNAGRQPALVGAAAETCCLATVESGEALRVPPGGAAAAWTVSLSTCDSVSAPTNGAAPLAVDPLLSTEIGLAALAGPDLPADLASFSPSTGPYTEQLGPLGVLLARDAAAALMQAVRQACGGLAPPVLLVSPGSVRVDRTASRVDVDAVLDVSPGLVRTVRLELDEPESAAAGIPYRSLRSTIGPLRPDRTGQVRVRLSYATTAGQGCLPFGGVLPPLTLVLEVPEGDTVRTVRYSTMVPLDQDPAVVPRFCPER